MSLDPRIPIEDRDRLSYELAQIRRELDKLALPSGTQRVGLLGYLASLATYAASGSSFNSGGVPNNSTTQWFQPTPAPAVVTLTIPAGRRLYVRASVGEASLTPTSGFCQAIVTFEVTRVSDGVVVWGRDIARGSLYTNQRLGTPVAVEQELSIATGVEYNVTLWCGVWAPTSGVGTATCQFNSPTLRVQILGDGP